MARGAADGWGWMCLRGRRRQRDVGGIEETVILRRWQTRSERCSSSERVTAGWKESMMMEWRVSWKGRPRRVAGRLGWVKFRFGW